MRPLLPAAHRLSRLLPWLGLASATLLFSSLAQADTPAPLPGAGAKPNVIFILVDDMGYGDCGVNAQRDRAARGLPAFQTPNLDRMAAEGVRLTDHYSSAPVCAPSRASLMQGLDQGRCTVRDNQFDKPLSEGPTLGSVLKAADYATGAVGKWGLGGKEAPWPAHPLRRGFDEYYGVLLHAAAHPHYPSEGLYDGYDPIPGLGGRFYDTDLYTARAKKFIAEHASGKQPFFLYLAYTLPHANEEYPPGPYPDGKGLHGGIQWPPAPYGTSDSYCYPEYKDKDWPEVEKRHASMMSHLDEAVGDVLQTVRDLGLENDTLVIFTSDNGPHNEGGQDPDFFSSAGPFDGIKRDLFEGGSREPTFAWWPGTIPAGTVSHEPSAQYDWLDTLAETAGVPAPGVSNGLSLLPALAGHPEAQRHAPFLYFEYFFKGGKKQPRSLEAMARKGYAEKEQMQAIRVGSLVGVRYGVKSAEDPFRLYDLDADPHQDHDLFRDSRYADTVRQMHDLLITSRTADPEAPRPYDNAPFPAVDAPAATGGLTRKLFDGAWPWMPDFALLASRATEAAPGLVLPTAAPASGAWFIGFVKIPTDGVYTLSVHADGGALLWLHEALVLNAPDGAPAIRSIPLKAGWHPLRLAYRHAAQETPALEFSLKDADGKDVPLPADAWGHS
jgi:arylsulfatase A-like enzyme